MKILLPYNNLTLFSVIDELDLPLLSHYIDGDKNHILKYVVSVDDGTIQCLIWRAKEINIYNYLNNKITLRELIIEDDKEFLYLFNSFSLNHENEVEVIPLKNIPADYLPDGNSYYGFSIPIKYEYLLDKYNSGFYIASLNDRGVVLRIAPKDKKYGHTVSLENVAEFTTRISNSYYSYVEQEFFKQFKNNIDDVKSFEKTKRKVLNKTAPRVCDVEFGSFEITISYDKINTESLESDILEWTNKIMDAYADNVLYVDYSNEKIVSKLLQSVSPLELKNIYEPFINTIAQKEYIVNVRTIGTDKSIIFNKDYKKTKKEFRKILLENTEFKVEEISKKKLVHLILEIDEKKEVKQLKKSEFSKDLIISYETKTFDFTIDEIERKEGKYFLDKPLDFEVEITDDNYYYIEHPLLEESLLVEDKLLIKDEINSSIQKIIERKFGGDILKFFEANEIKHR